MNARMYIYICVYILYICIHVVRRLCMALLHMFGASIKDETC